MATYYIVLLPNPDAKRSRLHPPFFEVKIQKKQEAVDVCLKHDLPHFYQLDTANPFRPKNVWYVVKKNDGYDLKVSDYAMLEAEHDSQCGHHSYE